MVSFFHDLPQTVTEAETLLSDDDIKARPNKIDVLKSSLDCCTRWSINNAKPSNANRTQLIVFNAESNQTLTVDDREVFPAS